MYYVLCIVGVAKIILADFNLVVSTPTAKPPNLNPCQIFRVYGTFYLLTSLHWMRGPRHLPPLYLHTRSDQLLEAVKASNEFKAAH